VHSGTSTANACLTAERSERAAGVLRVASCGHQAGVVFLDQRGTPRATPNRSGAPVTDSTIIYTHTDEAPALATYSLLPVIQAYAATVACTWRP